MAKAPSESRIPTFGSRIPIPGKLRIEKKDHITYNVNTTTVITQNPRDKNNIDGNCTIVLDTNSAEATFVLNNSPTATAVTTTNTTTILTKSEQVAPHRSDGIIEQHVGKRVCVGNEQTGVLHFVGEVHFTAGIWCGVELDEPVGKHDGLVKGVRYFSCRPGCGVMAPVSKVSVAHDNNNKKKSCDNNSTKILSKNIEVAAVVAAAADQNLTTIINPDSAHRNNKCRHSVVLSANEPHKYKLWNTNKLLNDTLISPIGDISFSCNSSTPTANRHTKIISPGTSDLTITRTLDLTATKINTNTNTTPGSSPVETPNLTKQNSFELDESLGILTPDQMIDISTFVKNSKTMSSDDLKAILITKRYDNKSLASSRTSSSENIVSLPKESSNSLTPVDVQSVRGVDESSLAILTPDQMGDYSVFVDTTMKSLEDQRSDKTISNSRTPSSENLGSMPNDGFKIPQTPILLEQKECDTSTSISRPISIDLKPLSKTMKLPSSNIQTIQDISSPNAVENSIIDFSLGLIEEDLLATGNQFSSMIDTTTNLELPLDSISGECKIEEFKSMSRSDQTPSPEDLPLDPIDPIKSVELEIIEPTLLNPSVDSDPKTDPSKSTTTTKTNSFITSVTSITSLDTGYQGDGEMSRPASRGADHSPMAHKPNNPALVNLQWQRAIARRQDPMTDSDFFTESDADNHDENVPKGDRRAQVIDGTLYGVNNNQAAAAAQDIFIANQEEMDSSGVFTDLEMNNRADDFSDGERNRMEVVPTEDKSPSDISTKSITENSQEIKEPEDMDSTLVNQTDVTLVNSEQIIIIEKPKSPTQSIISTTSSRKSQRTRTPLSKEQENPSKKFKMPKRNVTSKVKSMMEHKQVDLENQENRKPIRKPVGRWDAVMNKISKGQEENKSKIRLKEVKSKVATGIAGAGNPTNKRSETRKFTPEESLASKAKIRRIRARDESLAGSKPTSRTASSIHSSLSDLSVGLSSNSNKQVLPHAVINRVNKKREVGRCATPVTEVLTPNGHKPTPVTSPRTITTSQQKTTRDIKKSSTLPTNAAPDGKSMAGRRAPSGRNVGAVSALKSSSLATVVNKDQSRVTGVTAQKGGSPVRNQVLQEKTQVANLLLPHVKHSAKGVEALGVLVQYLVFNLDAFRTPSLKRELESIRTQWIKDKLELEETRMGYRRLEDTVSEQKILASQTLEEERVKYRAEIAELFEKHRRDIGELNDKNTHEKLELERRYEEDNSELKNQLDAEISNREHEISVRIEAYVTEHRYRLQELERENEKLRRDNQIAVEILREENDSIREQLDEKTNVIEDLKELRFVNEKLKNELGNKEKLFEDKLINAHDEIALLKEENKKILETFKSDTKDNKLQNGHPEKCSVVPQAALGRCTQLQDEVESLRTVLDLKLAELSELRRAHGELSQAAEELPAALLRAQALQARVEDLELQLERKTELELQLTKENKRLQESFNQESKQNKRLSLHNEELQWKLKQNSEVVNAIILQGQQQQQQQQTPNRKPLHGSNQSLCDEMSLKCGSGGGYLNRTHHTSSSFNEKHHHHGTSQHILERTLSFRERTLSQSQSQSYGHFVKDNKSPSRCNNRQSESSNSNDRSSTSNKSEYFELEDSPPSSPKVKGVVEKSDSVSWVLDMDESPEVIASRMVRRAGSFRNVTPPKSTPTKQLQSPATKRPRTKSNNLSLSASAGAIINNSSDDKNDNRHRSKSVNVTLRDSRQSPETCHPGEYLSNSWHYSLRTSTPNKQLSACASMASADMETIRTTTIKLENNPDLEHDSDIAICLPALPSQIPVTKAPDSLPSLPSGDLLLLQSSFPPKNAAGEAMISESNSEDDECSSSTSERSPSVSDTETSEEPIGDSKYREVDVDADADADEKPPKMQYDLFLLTESTTNSEAMDCSWSEELDVV